MRINYPPQLPITAAKDEIIRAVQAHQVVVVAGDTGSGKTTQLPKMCLEAGRAADGRLIGCTQPRRIAAVSVAERVQEELAAAELVGYKIRFSDRTSAQTRIKFMTDGVLLAETQGDRTLRRYDTLIIDEAHERSLNIDFLLGYLHQLLDKRPDLKLLISSATIDTEKFSRHFHDAPIIQVEGRSYPVRVEYRPPGSDAEEEDEADRDIDELVIEQVRGLMSRPGGDILVFMPTERDIRIFLPAQQRKIIVATNVAETSITVPGIETVIDTGRCGRIGPGFFRPYVRQLLMWLGWSVWAGICASGRTLTRTGRRRRRRLKRTRIIRPAPSGFCHTGVDSARSEPLAAWHPAAA